MLRNVRFFNAGYCWQLSALADGKGWGARRFYAVFVYAEHPKLGAILIDSGYSDRFYEVTRSLPQALYKWLTPVKLDEKQNAATILEAHGIDSNSIQSIFISHFHADHIAGLRCFPTASFIYVKEGFDYLMQQSLWSQVKHGFLKELLPEDFLERSSNISLSDFNSGQGTLSAFQTLDYFFDGSLQLVSLPGHAFGQLGFFILTDSKPLLYVSDACWNIDILKTQTSLPKLSQRVQHDYTTYQTTIKTLGQLDLSNMNLLACHCPQTQAFISNA